jgi:hypothetical protein
MTQYVFDLNLSTPQYAIEISTADNYGYFQNNTTGTEGGLWFDGLRLSDYDGVYDLPKPVYTALVNAGFKLEDI